MGCYKGVCGRTPGHLHIVKNNQKLGATSDLAPFPFFSLMVVGFRLWARAGEEGGLTSE